MDFDPAPEGEDDPDDDDNIPIPQVKPKGKDSDYSPVAQISDDEGDDDCRILDLLDPTPISWAPASVPAKTDAGQVHLGNGQTNPRRTRPRQARERRG